MPNPISGRDIHYIENLAVIDQRGFLFPLQRNRINFSWDCGSLQSYGFV